MSFDHDPLLYGNAPPDSGVAVVEQPHSVESIRQRLAELAALPVEQRVALLGRFTPEERAEFMEAVDGFVKTLEANQLDRYKPQRKQRLFHHAGAIPGILHRLFMAANQSGKTYAGAFETAMHATGRYPAMWTGLRFNRPVVILAGSESAELTKKGVQRLLLGRPEDRDDWGNAAIPKDAIHDVSMRQGVPDTVASIVVKHKSGGKSVIQLVSYEQGRTKWQADTVDFVWFDEEPPEDVYTEGITRLNATGGSSIMTFTPLLGMSNVVMRYLKHKLPGTTVIKMTLDDAEHYTPQRRAEIAAQYLAHEREARVRGEPMMGKGRIYPVAEEAIKCTAFPIPAHWLRLCGLDFGWTHPTAAVWLAIDPDTRKVYVTDVHRVAEADVIHHAAAIKARGAWVPVAWPHDGDNKTAQGGGKPLAKQYEAQGCTMLPERSTSADGSASPEADVQTILVLMQAGMLKVFAHLEEWFEEFRMYHRDEKGLIVRQLDDVMSATRYGVRMIRHAKSALEAGVGVFGYLGVPIDTRPLDTIAGY